MKKLPILIALLALLPRAPWLAAQDKPEMAIVSPLHGQIWFGVTSIRIKVEHLPADMLHAVEVYLDGRLIKEFKAPPYSFSHDFGKVPGNSTLKAVLRGRGQVLGSAEIKSYAIDDAQEVDVTQVLVPVVVVDSKGNYVSNLKKDDFILLEDNVPQAINNFSKSGKTEFHLVLLIDISSSMKDKIGTVKEAARQFLKELLTANDKAIIVFFNHEVFEDTEFSGDISELSNSISMAFPFGATALYDAIGYCLKLLTGMPGLNIMIILSDGEDNSSYMDPYTLIKKAERSNSIIYAIGQGGGSAGTEYQEILDKLSTTSGGMLFTMEDPQEIRKIYELIRRDIKAEYVLEFSPTKSGKTKRYRRITVKLKSGKKYTIRTLKGYYY